MGEFIDKNQLRLAAKYLIEVQFVKDMPFVLYRLPWNQCETGEKCLRFHSAMGFNDTHRNIDAFAFTLLRRLQHGKRLANAGRGPKEHFEPPSLPVEHHGEQGIGRRAILFDVFGHLV